ncbi:MAG: undecaprenyl/decaprenyl-phosphate alpha-N-acetylglucosaminyl 1-phosphate transferase [Bacteroidales bacterium]|nr:undecaprenyl/decaprenyl-phosphate alpha-N-acetylglucosaminyl 1-phosphate transferase [Bacteroidales bacterium]
MKTSELYLVLAYFFFFIVVLIFSLLINKILLKFSGNLGVRGNIQCQVRFNSQSKPSFGGISFFIIFLLSITALAFVFSENNLLLNFKLLGIIVATTLGFAMGLFDDAYNTRVPIKLLSQICCGVILIVSGTYISVFESNTLNYILTILWVVGLMNSINMLDNMDAVATLVSIFILLGIFIQNILAHGLSTNLNIVILGIISSLIGFLVYNWPPSKMYMGDTGSQFLGVVLATFSIIFIWDFKEYNLDEIPTKQICAVLMFFALPIIDTATVSIKRILKGKSPFIGGKDHTTHHLAYLGLSEKKVAVVIAVLSAISVTLGIICLNIHQWTHGYTAIFVAYFLILFTVLFTIANINKDKSNPTDSQVNGEVK